MLRSRIIPVLLIKDGGLVKTVNFGSPKYVGDPLNAVRIFNEKEVDELIVLDIDATVRQREPDYKLIQSLAAECRMPLSYGGGVNSVEQIQRIISLGVEKVSLSAAAVANPGLITAAAEQVGRQSLVAVMDVKRSGLLRRYELFTHNGSKASGLHPVEFAKTMQAAGVGEIVINAIEQDGVMQGYDLKLAQEVRAAVSVPITVLGGAGKLGDIEDLIGRFGTIGAAAGSLFVFKGVYRAVLINYPNRQVKDAILAGARARGAAGH
jgi:imidazole glycerol-phosphate synthase subunit HisF